MRGNFMEDQTVSPSRSVKVAYAPLKVMRIVTQQSLWAKDKWSLGGGAHRTAKMLLGKNELKPLGKWCELCGKKLIDKKEASAHHKVVDIVRQKRRSVHLEMVSIFWRWYRMHLL